ncbi:MAG: hypothetical protein IJ252_02235 [Solobacterium sp.]|nr:hypothetical protein [Solobacterium sp.]
MTQTDELFRYLQENYRENEPIFLSEIDAPDIKPSCVRPLLKKLVDDGRIKRFDTGIYYVPKKTFFRSGSALPVESVISKKYLYDQKVRCGYYCGMLLANQLGLTTQVPMVFEVITNKATTEYRETQLGNYRVIVKRPCVNVTPENAEVLQFLDLLKEVTDISELNGSELTKKLTGYMKAKGIGFESLKPYLPNYPDKIYRNMYEVGLLNAVSA